MMNTAFEVTVADVVKVLGNHGIAVTNELAEQIFNNHIAPLADIIEHAALAGIDMDEQTDYAHQEIELILRENNIIP